MKRVLNKLPTEPSKKALVVNYLLLIIIVAVNCYILWGLFGPRLSLEVQKATQNPPVLPQSSSVQSPPAVNRLIIPSIYVDTKINEGAGEEAEVDGVWRRPGTGTPSLGSNTAIAGHRFTYQGASTFYNLDQVKVGDEIGVWYDQKFYAYSVSEIRIVDPNDKTVESESDQSKLTLYTCTPLWTTNQRLVVIALPKEQIQ